MLRLQVSNSYFAELKTVSLQLSRRLEYEEYCAPEDASDCDPQRSVVEDVLTLLGVDFTLDNNDHECMLDGVDCDLMTWSPIGFEYYRDNLVGLISTKIGLLSDLKDLDLRYNVLTGTIPTEIGQFTNLNSCI